MIRRALIAAGASLCVSASCALAGTTARGLELTPVKAKFPNRAYVLSLPAGTTLANRSVIVRENGTVVTPVTISPTTGASGSHFGTVLAIDTSNSMAGQPLHDAYAAARAFAARRNPSQQLGIVTFNSHVRVMLQPTTNGNAIAAALARPPVTANGTHLFDALVAASTVLKQSGVTAPSIVVISDGTDVGSHATEASALSDVRRLHVRVFSVGLLSPQFAPGVLRGFADATDAAYSQATNSRNLKTVYDRLGYKLANEYLLQYRSLVGPQEPVEVMVTLKGVGGAAATVYRSPALPNVALGPVHKSIVDRILQSGYTMLVVVALIAALLGIGVAAATRPKQSLLRRRLGEFVSVTDPEADDGKPDAPAAGRLSFWDRLERDIEIGQVPLRADQIAFLSVVGTVLAVWLLAVILSPIFAVFGLFVPVIARWSVGRQADRQRRLFGEQLPDNLQVLSSALRSGHSLIGALAAVVDDAPEPSRREFRRVVADEQAGVPLDDAIRRTAARMENRDLEQVALVAALQRQAGGNSAEVLDRVAETVRERAALRRLVRTLTAQGRMARWIVSALPIGLLILISLINGKYMKPMFDRTLGQAMVVFAAAMVIAGSLVIRKIIDIKV